MQSIGTEPSPSQMCGLRNVVSCLKHQFPSLEKETNVHGVSDPLKGFNYYYCQYRYFLHHELSGVFVHFFLISFIKVYFTVKFAKFRYTV